MRSGFLSLNITLICNWRLHMAHTTGKLDWSKINYWCSDVVCPCGQSIHHCTHDDTSARFFCCPKCRTVLAFDDQVRLIELPDRERNFNHPESLHVTEPDANRAFIQWKGSDVTMEVECLCGESFAKTGEFAYQADCPHCCRHYQVDSHMRISNATPEQLSPSPVVHECECEDDDC